MTLNTLNKALKVLTVTAVALTSTVFQASGCTIDVSNMAPVLNGLLSELPTDSLTGITPTSFTSGSSTSTTSYSPTTSGWTGYNNWNSWDNWNSW